MSNNLLITGGAGFIGANFVLHWSKAYPNDQLVVVDALTYAGNKQTLSELISSNKIVFRQLNICQQQQISELLKEYQINIIVNFAAESHVDRSITGPDAFIETNINGTHSLLKAAKENWLDTPVANHRFHHISTDEVYGTLTSEQPAFTEQNQYLPNSPYAASKAASDHLVRAYHETYGLNTTISNCSNNFGPYHFPEKLMPLVITNILFDKPLPIYGDGKQIRDWLFVTDHCKAIELILAKGKAGQTYNVGGNNEQFNIDIVTAICSSLNNKFKQNKTLATLYPQAKSAIAGKAHELITHVEDRLGHDRRYAVNAEKIKQELCFSPNENFNALLEQTVDWYLANQDWWLPLRNR